MYIVSIVHDILPKMLYVRNCFTYILPQSLRQNEGIEYNTIPCDPTATHQGRGGESCYQVTQTSVLAAPLASVLTLKEWHWNHETHGNHVNILWNGVLPKPHFMCVRLWLH